MEGAPREIRKALEGGGWWFYEAKRGDAEVAGRFLVDAEILRS
jgi:hypothetical protein